MANPDEWLLLPETFCLHRNGKILVPILDDEHRIGSDALLKLHLPVAGARADEVGAARRPE